MLAKGLALSSTIDYRLKPLIERFGERPIAEIKTADIDDFVADLKQPRVVNGLDGRRLTAASINRTLGAAAAHAQLGGRTRVPRRTPFRRGTEVLIRMELEDNKRRRRISEEEEAALLTVASPHLRSMIIAWNPRVGTIADAVERTPRRSRISGNAQRPRRAARRRIRRRHQGTMAGAWQSADKMRPRCVGQGVPTHLCGHPCSIAAGFRCS